MALEAQCHNKSSKMLEKFYLGILITCGCNAAMDQDLHAEQRSWGSNSKVGIIKRAHAGEFLGII